MSKRIKLNTEWDLYEEWFWKPYRIYMYLVIGHNLCSSALSAFKPFWLAPQALYHYLLNEMKICDWHQTPVPHMYVKAPFNCITIQLISKYPDSPLYLKVDLIRGSLTYQLKRKATVSHFMYGKVTVDIIDFVKQLINFIS